MSRRILLNYGFETILSDFWTKDGFGVSEIDGKYYAARASEESINSEEDLKFYFKKYTGKELEHVR